MTPEQEPVIFGQPWFGQEERELVLRTLESGWIGQGPLVERFESALCEYLGAKHAVAVNSCTAALHLSLIALGIGPGDEVITTPFTFVATINAIEHVGATPVLVDIDPSSLNLDTQRVARAIGPSTVAILAVDFGGRPVDPSPYKSFVDRYGLWIIEDAAHAIGAVADGHRVGGSRHPRWLTCFSFYPNKNLASAEGGAITLEDPALADRLRSLRLHGLDIDAWKRYTDGSYRPSLAVEDGYKYNWTDLQASVALPQLERLEGFLAVREFLADEYDERLGGHSGITLVDRGPRELAWRHALHLYQVRVSGGADVRDALVDRLRKRGIGAAIHYLGINWHPRYRDRLPHSDLLQSDTASAEIVSLPLHPKMHIQHVDRVAKELVDGLAIASKVAGR